VECKVTRSDFLADRNKPFRVKPKTGVGCERYYLVPQGLIAIDELPAGWGLLELDNRKLEVVKRSRKDMRTEAGFGYEMNLLLASLRRVEVRIEPQTITDFLKWKNRMADYNGGTMPHGLKSPGEEMNLFTGPGELQVADILRDEMEEVQ
jgi:hypothetical protein